MADLPTTTVLDDFRVLIGSRIRERREFMGRSQAELARILGKQVPAVSLIESGRNNITAAELLVISHILKAPIEYFFGAGGNLADEENALMYFRTVDADEQQIVLKMLRALAIDKGV